MAVLHTYPITFAAVARQACSGFLRFMHELDTSDDPENYETLEQYIKAWVRMGDAILDCAGDFGAFAAGQALIIVTYLDDPTVLGFHDPQKKMPRSIRGIFEDVGGEGPVTLDQFAWEQDVFKFRLNGSKHPRITGSGPTPYGS